MSPIERWTDLADWLVRARRMIPHQDRKVLLSPPRLVARFARFAMNQFQREITTFLSV